MASIARRRRPISSAPSASVTCVGVGGGGGVRRKLVYVRGGWRVGRLPVYVCEECAHGAGGGKVGVAVTTGWADGGAGVRRSARGGAACRDGSHDAVRLSTPSKDRRLKSAQRERALRVHHGGGTAGAGGSIPPRTLLCPVSLSCALPQSHAACVCVSAAIAAAPPPEETGGGPAARGGLGLETGVEKTVWRRYNCVRKMGRW
eukprot:scaffold4698_cov115-Isochrysis_galbana.AAC.6